MSDLISFCNHTLKKKKMLAFLRWASCRIFLHIKGPVGKGGIGCFYWRESTDRDLFCPSWQSREDQSKEQTGILAMCGKNIRQCSPDLPSIVPPTDETSITKNAPLYKNSLLCIFFLSTLQLYLNALLYEFDPKTPSAVSTEGWSCRSGWKRDAQMAPA